MTFTYAYASAYKLYNQYKKDFENFFRIQEESAHKIRTKKYLFVIK